MFSISDCLLISGSYVSPSVESFCSFLCVHWNQEAPALPETSPGWIFKSGFVDFGGITDRAVSFIVLLFSH